MTEQKFKVGEKEIDVWLSFHPDDEQEKTYLPVVAFGEKSASQWEKSVKAKLILPPFERPKKLVKKTMWQAIETFADVEKSGRLYTEIFYSKEDALNHSKNVVAVIEHEVEMLDGEGLNE